MGAISMGIIFWIGLFFWFSFIAWTRHLQEQERQKTLRTFAERGQPLDPNTLQQLFPKSGFPPRGRAESSAEAAPSLMVGGIVLLFAAIGMLIAGQLFLSQIHAHARWGLSGAASITGMVGVGMLVASFALRRLAAADRKTSAGTDDDAR
jgi:hypothetical protein